jgi:hypothetical protein
VDCGGDFRGSECVCASYTSDGAGGNGRVEVDQPAIGRGRGYSGGRWIKARGERGVDRIGGDGCVRWLAVLVALPRLANAQEPSPPIPCAWRWRG